MSVVVMAEATIPLRDQDEAQAIVGPCDDYLRRVRQRTSTQIVLRGNLISVTGDEQNVELCENILKLWQTILRSNGELLESDVIRSLDSNLEGDALQNDITGSGNGRSITGSFSDEGTHSRSEPLTAAVPPKSRDIRAARGGRDKVAAIRAKTDGQAGYMEAMQKNPLVFCEGPAGCGKTYLAVAMALQALRDEEVRKIVLVRPAVEAGEKLGFLPGDMFAKVNPFVRPLLDAMNDMLDYDQVRRYMANDVIEIAPLAFMRGRTLNDTFMILDEGQNTTITQMKMFLTRMGINSRIVVTGDSTQNDLPKGTTSGLVDGIRRLHRIRGVAIVKLSGDDIVRHRLVREIVSAYETPDSSDSTNES
ncbi:MAG: PhoH family protein [Planctomycetaceae bacterium]